MVVVCSEPSEDDRLESVAPEGRDDAAVLDVVETGNQELTVRPEPGYYDVSFGRDVRVTAEHVMAIARPLPLGTTANFLIRCRGITAVSASAIDSYSRFSSIARVAFLGEGPADRILTRFFSRSVVSGHESEYFEDEAVARAWLVDPK